MFGFMDLLQPWALALLIFGLRIVDMSLDTIRVLFVVRGRKVLVWVLGFFQSLVFVVAISSVLSKLDNPYNMLAYAGGFATGNVLGMFIEERLAVGFIQMTIVSSTRGAAIAEQLRENGYAVTELAGRGRNGTVTMLSCAVRRREIDHAETVVMETDASAFVTIEDVRPLRRGFWRA